MLALPLALLIFGLSLLAILIRPRGASEAVSSCVGGLIMVVSGVVPVRQAASMLLSSWNILLFFTGLVLIAWATEESGFFRWVALWAGRLAGGDTHRLLLCVFAFGAIISTFLSNDATALLLTPVVVAVTQELNLPPLPFALTCTFIADTASVSLPVSNPINVLVLDSFDSIRLGGYLQHLLVPSLAVIALNVVLFLVIFRNRTGTRFDPSKLPAPSEAARNRGYFGYALVCLGVLAAAYLAASLVGLPLSLVALAGAAVLLVGGVATRALSASRLREMPWTVVPFIAGLLVLVQGLEDVGVTRWLGSQLLAVTNHGQSVAVLTTTLGTAVGANIINNVPMATVMAATIRQGHVAPIALRHGLVYAVILGSDIGPNLTTIGSLSTVLWLVLLRRRHVEVTAWQYVRTGLLVTPPMLVLGALLIALFA